MTQYQSGFGNYFSTEAIEGALPLSQNSPQKTKLGLYPEQLTGSAFTTAQHENLRSWLYRIMPSVVHDNFKYREGSQPFAEHAAHPTPPNQLRWSAAPMHKTETTLINGIEKRASNQGGAIYHYNCNTSKKNEYFYSADGDWLVVPEHGALLFKTELGRLEVAPNEIIVIPRGIKWQVELRDKNARGYIIENQGAPFKIPDLGPIGANGLAYPRHFHYPVAAFEDNNDAGLITAKFEDHLWEAAVNHSPLNVAAWHGNYAPYKYDLTEFNAINTVSFDHPDPSIFTVLTSQTERPGVANIDFVIFPARWMVAENTFRPPYFHRNIMSEYMGLITGTYDAKESGGFEPGGASLHNSMSAHGPDSKTVAAAMEQDLKPAHYKDTLAFMFESSHIWRPTVRALESETLQKDYMACWQGMDRLYE